MAGVWNPNWSDPAPTTAPTSTLSGAQADNSSPLNRGIPKGIGSTGRVGDRIVDPDHFGGVRLVNGRLIVTLVLGFQDTDLGGASSLVWLKANDQFIYRAQSPKRAFPSQAAIYGGDQTEVDPTILAALGASETTMWPGLAYIVLKDFDITPYSDNPQIPVFTAHWATDATQVASSETTSTATFGSFGTYLNASLGIDFSTNLAYLYTWDSNTEVQITTIDLCTETEINRVLLDTSNTYGYGYFTNALQGSDFIVVQNFTLNDSGDIAGLRLINARTGEIVATLDSIKTTGYFEPGIWGSVLLKSDTATKYLVFCHTWASTGIIPNDVDANDGMVVLADITNGTLEYIAHPVLNPIRTVANGQETPESFAIASVNDGAATVYFTENNEFTVYRMTVTESGVSGVTAVYTDGTSELTSCAYDAIDNALIIFREDNFAVKYDLNTSTATYTIDKSTEASGSSLYINSVYFPANNAVQPGFGVVTRGNANASYLMDFSDGSLTLLPDPTGDDNFTYVDQYRGKVINPSTTDGLVTISTLGDLTPNSIDASNIITSLMTYNGDYVSGDLTFTNFAGNEAEGLDVSTDTTIDALMRDVTGTLGIREVHDNGKVKFSMPPRDGAYAIDVTLTDNDITNRGMKQKIDDEDSAYERTLVSYSDIDVSFERITQEYARPNGAYEVLKSNKRRNINTALTMTSTQASKAAQRITYESDLDRTSFEFDVMPAKFAIEPTAITQFNYGPNDEFTIVGEVRRATLNDDLSQSLEVREYLQAIETTFAGTGLVTVPVVCNPAQPVNLTILDTALLDYGDDLGGSGLRGYASLSGIGTADIGNSALYVSDDGFTYSTVGTRTAIAPVGGKITALTGTLPDGFQTDFVNTMDVQISSGVIGDLTSTDEAGRYALTNFAAIGAKGRWVLISYEDVSISGQVATLSNIIWGVRGTEAYTSQLAVGDEFHNLETADIIKYGSNIGTLNSDLFYKAGYTGYLIGSLPTSKNIADGEAEKCYAPVQVAGVDNAGDVDMTCEFRERLDPIPVLTGAKAAGYSDGTNFEWDIMGGSPLTVQRTLTSTTNAVTYPSASFIADFGSPTPASFTARVYHMNGLGERGHVSEATITP